VEVVLVYYEWVEVEVHLNALEVEMVLYYYCCNY